MDTYAYFYDMLNSMLQDRNKQINQLQAQNQALK